jgi:subtilisin family serine protease
MRYPSSDYDLSRLLLWTERGTPAPDSTPGLVALGLVRVTNLQPSLGRVSPKWAFDFSRALSPSGLEDAFRIIRRLVQSVGVQELIPAPRRFFDCAPAACGARQLAQRAWSAYPPTWHLDALGSHQPPGGRPVAIAVLDSGADATHPSLSGLLKSTLPLTDLAGHGTHVASTICGRPWGTPPPLAYDPDYDLEYVPSGILAGREISVVNIAKPRAVFEVDLLKFFWEIDSIRNGTPQILDLLNLSYGGPAFCGSEQNALTTIPGSPLVVAAAGNDSRRVLYPAGYPECLSVAASTRDTAKILAPFIPWNRNSDAGNSPERIKKGLPAVDVYAPGRNIAGAVPVTGANALRPAGFRSGTSMATAYTTGVFGLLYSTTGVTSKLADARIRIAKLAKLSNGGHHLIDLAAQNFF